MMGKIHPHGYRIAVHPSPVDSEEEQRPSGLIITHATDDGMDEPPMQRGIVMEVSEMHAAREDPVFFEIGAVVYYRYFDAIRDTHIVSSGNVIAYE